MLNKGKASSVIAEKAILSVDCNRSLSLPHPNIEIFDGIGCSCTSASTSSVGQVSVLGVVHPIRARSMNVCGIKMYLQHNKFIHRYSVF